MTAKENLTPLKTLVFSMGAVLVIGTALLIVLVWGKVNAGGDCTGGQIDLKGKGVMVESAVDGQTLRATLQKNEGHSETVLIDMCGGKIITSLTLETDKAVAGE